MQVSKIFIARVVWLYASSDALYYEYYVIQDVPRDEEQSMRRQAIQDMMRDPKSLSPVVTSPHRLSSIGTKLSVEDLSYNRIKLSPSVSRRAEDTSLSRTL